MLKKIAFPVAVFASHDHLGTLVLEACKKANLEIPQQVSVLGVGNFELLCDIARPALSSIAQRGREVGYAAARLLDQIVQGKAEKNTKILLPPGELIKRHSTDFLAIDDDIVRDAVEFIRHRYVFPISAEDVAQKVCVSRRTLDKRFLKVRGRTPSQEIAGLRLQRAQELLTTTKEPIAAIAMQSGFGSISGFNRVFSESTDLTPRQYRQQNGY